MSGFSLTPLGSPDAAACEGDACLIPGAEQQPPIEQLDAEARA